MIVYQTQPIDYWRGWNRIETARDNDDFEAWIDPPWRGDILKVFRRARRIARQHLDWEGDVAAGPYWVPLPLNASPGYEFVVAWKQQNNGSTFVAAPWPLPWLEEPDECGDVAKRWEDTRRRRARAQHGRLRSAIGGRLKNAAAPTAPAGPGTCARGHLSQIATPHDGANRGFLPLSGSGLGYKGGALK